LAPKLNTDEVAELMGFASANSADQALRRKGVAPVGREPGRTGKNLYDEDEVIAAFPERPHGPRRQ
jgi:hypothetical protein